MASSRANLLRLCHSDPFRTPLRRCRKTVRISAGTLSELNRNGVRNGSECCPIKIVEVSENRRNTQQVAKTQIKTVHTLPVGSFNSISRFLQSMIADTTLVRNLENPKLPQDPAPRPINAGRMLRPNPGRYRTKRITRRPKLSGKGPLQNPSTHPRAILPGNHLPPVQKCRVTRKSNGVL